MSFNFAFNKTSTIQSFFASSVHPLTIEPYQAVDVSQIHGDTSEILQPINSFLNYLDIKGVRRFYIYRTFALGDILMLVPVIRALKKQGYDPYLRTVAWAKPILDLLGVESVVLKPQHHPPQNEYGIMMDGLVEQDHMRPKLSHLHRVDIYFKALGRKAPRKLNWDMDVKKLPSFEADSEYVVLQTSGSTLKKQLPPSTRDFLVKAFKNDGISVVLIGESNMLSPKRLFSVIYKAKCLITMDSSPLWISHFTKTPTIGLFGPTRPSERLIYHPLWPKRAIGIRLNEKIDPPCESCFENVKMCNDRIDCLKISGEKLYRLIHPYVLRLLKA